MIVPDCMITGFGGGAGAGGVGRGWGGVGWA